MNSKYALVTGASSGIGKCYAQILARDYHYNLLLVSNQQKELQEVAEQLSNEYKIEAIPHYSDLARTNAAKDLYEWCQAEGYEVEVLINNAGMFFWKTLIDVDPKKIECMLLVHMHTLAMMCRYFGEDMCKRGSGYILNMSSLTYKMTFPGIQCYNSTKAFVYSFSKSLWYEFKPLGVKVCTLTPGAIDTPLYGLNDKARRLLVRFGISFTPMRFAAIALKRMFKGRKTAMPGWINHIALPIIIHLPDWAIFFAMKRLPQYEGIYNRRS